MSMRNLNLDGVVVGPVPKREESDAVAGVCGTESLANGPRIFCYPA